VAVRQRQTTDRDRRVSPVVKSARCALL
jgi:hypothetical protein